MELAGGLDCFCFHVLVPSRGGILTLPLFQLAFGQKQTIF